MLDQTLVSLVLLLGAMVFVVLVFYRLHIPPSLAYLFVGVLLGTHTAGPSLDTGAIEFIAQFGIVFLLFTIGLSFSVAQIYAQRYTIAGFGTAQVGLTTLVVCLLAWLVGLPWATAFVVGAVFAQSSTTIITKQLMEQGEDQTRHGRLGTTMSVFQDVTAVPFVVIIPVLGIVATDAIAVSLGGALLKASLAIALVLLIGRYLLSPLFHAVAVHRSGELFTLTVLFVALAAGGLTHWLGLSVAFGAFLAGMVLGETEFKHQVEAAIRPFRDVLLGLFFVSIGMLFNPSLLPAIWFPALLGMLVLMGSKILLVTLIVRYGGLDIQTAFRTGILLSVGGEFGFALLAIGLEGHVIAQEPAQIALAAVMFSMITAPFLIRYNQVLAAKLFANQAPVAEISPKDHYSDLDSIRNHVVICGFGRIGQVVSRFLEREKIAYVALDMDATIVRSARIAGQPVFFGDSSEHSILEAVHIDSAKLVIISHDDMTATIKTLKHIRRTTPELPIVVRTRDETRVEELRKAGATEVIPETLEAGMMIVSHALLALNLPLIKVARCLQEQRVTRYQMLRGLFRSESDEFVVSEATTDERLLPLPVGETSSAIGKTLQELDPTAIGVVITTLVRNGKRLRYPSQDMRIEAGDVLVLLGSIDELEKAQQKWSEPRLV